MVNIDWKGSPARTYRDLALDFGQMAGYGKDGWPVVKPDTHPEQWRAWYAYFKWRRLEGSMALMREGRPHTVPALSPFDFDAEFNPSGGLPAVPAFETSNRTPPFMIRTEKARYANEHRPVLYRDVSNEQFQALSKSGQLPPGASWVAALSTIYGPAPNAAQQAA